MRQLADFTPAARVYRWWDSGAMGAQIQYLTVVRVNRKTVTVKTDQGNTFRIEPHLLDFVTWEE